MKFLIVFIHVLLISMQNARALFWNFAVTTKSKITFYDEHWKEVTTSAHEFKQLSALHFDESEEILYFSDLLHNNDSIFSLQLPILIENQPHLIDKIVERIENESITGIAYDPLERTIYWTDQLNKKIYYMETLNTTTNKPKILFDFKNENVLPDGLAIDICRRKIYWTNSNFKDATIERANLDGTQREKIIKDLYLPHGIIVDQLSDRIYWVNDQQGIHFAIESANLNGEDRHTIVQGLNNVPLNLAIYKDGIFWTDSTNNAVWSHPKTLPTNSNQTDETAAKRSAEQPHKVLSFSDEPRGIVARTRYISTLLNDTVCKKVVSTIRDRLIVAKVPRSSEELQIEILRREYCLNGGEYHRQSGNCICKIGYEGARCDISECYNYCVHGTCSISSQGSVKCTCQHGFTGDRCQQYKCTDYCFNDGRCTIEENGEPTCECRDNFGGDRCEQNSTEICSLFCRILKHEPDVYVPFGCHDICQDLARQSIDGVEIYAIPKFKHLETCPIASVWSGTVIIVLVCGSVLSLSLVVLIINGLRRFYKPLRPRIKKTFVVRKQATSSNGTPLTNRPVATEQCEITIENCCNMNICETPCFDPKLVQQTLTRDLSVKEDKKILIHNMEDELY